jgi:outer membrane protein
MKKIVLTFAALVAFTFANAQEAETSTFGFAQGDVMLEGNFNFNSENNKDAGTKTSSMNFNPKVGYFITDDFAAGISLGLGSGKTETEIPGFPTTETTSSRFDFGVFGRYYFLDLGERFKTYSELGLGMASTKNEDAAGNETKENGFNAGVGLGINYFVTENFAINFTLANVISYNNVKEEAGGVEGEGTTEFGVNLNEFNNFFSTAQFGLTWKF